MCASSVVDGGALALANENESTSNSQFEAAYRRARRAADAGTRQERPAEEHLESVGHPFEGPNALRALTGYGMIPPVFLKL